MKNNNWRHLRLIIMVDNLCASPTEYFNWFLSVKRQLLYAQFCPENSISEDMQSAASIMNATQYLPRLLRRSRSLDTTFALGPFSCNWLPKSTCCCIQSLLRFRLESLAAWADVDPPSKTAVEIRMDWICLSGNSFQVAPTFDIVDCPGFLGLRGNIFRLEFQGEFCVGHHSRGVVTVVEWSGLRLRMSFKWEQNRELIGTRFCFSDCATLIL